MKEEQLSKALKLRNNITTIESDIARITEILEDFDSYRSNITFQKEGCLGYSFGTKKFKIKSKLRILLVEVKEQLQQELEENKKQFEKI